MPTKEKEQIFITFLVDNSGSMDMSVPYINDAMRRVMDDLHKDSEREYVITVYNIGWEGGLNSYIKKLKGESPRDFSAYTMKAEMGITPLFDGIDRALNTSNDPAGMGFKSLLILITDGGEGGSFYHPYNWEHIRQLIRDKVFTGWKFAYLAIYNDNYDTNSRQQAKEILQEVKEEGKGDEMIWLGVQRADVSVYLPFLIKAVDLVRS